MKLTICNLSCLVKDVIRAEISAFRGEISYSHQRVFLFCFPTHQLIRDIHNKNKLDCSLITFAHSRLRVTKAREMAATPYVDFQPINTSCMPQFWSGNFKMRFTLVRRIHVAQAMQETSP